MKIVMEIPIEIIIGAISVVFFLLVLIIGFMFKVLTENTKAIEGINITLAKMETKDVFEESDCKTKHGYIAKKLDSHDKRITKLETK